MTRSLGLGTVALSLATLLAGGGDVSNPDGPGGSGAAGGSGGGGVGGGAGGGGDTCDDFIPPPGGEPLAVSVHLVNRTGANVFLDSPLTNARSPYDADNNFYLLGSTSHGAGPIQIGSLGAEYSEGDTIHFAMYVGDGKDPAFTITYKRKK